LGAREKFAVLLGFGALAYLLYKSVQVGAKGVSVSPAASPPSLSLPIYTPVHAIVEKRLFFGLEADVKTYLYPSQDRAHVVVVMRGFRPDTTTVEFGIAFPHDNVRMNMPFSRKGVGGYVVEYHGGDLRVEYDATYVWRYRDRCEIRADIHYIRAFNPYGYFPHGDIFIFIPVPC
jgi:hypothetical protein